MLIVSVLDMHYGFLVSVLLSPLFLLSYGLFAYWITLVLRLTSCTSALYNCPRHVFVTLLASVYTTSSINPLRCWSSVRLLIDYSTPSMDVEFSKSIDYFLVAIIDTATTVDRVRLYLTGSDQEQRSSFNPTPSILICYKCPSWFFSYLLSLFAQGQDTAKKLNSIVCPRRSGDRAGNAITELQCWHTVECCTDINGRGIHDSENSFQKQFRMCRLTRCDWHEFAYWTYCRRLERNDIET